MLPAVSVCTIMQTQCTYVGNSLVSLKPIFHQKPGSLWVSFRIPTCWYRQHDMLALGVKPNASTQREQVCVLLEYRLYTWHTVVKPVVVGTRLQCTHVGWGSVTSIQCVHYKCVHKSSSRHQSTVHPRRVG